MLRTSASVTGELTAPTWTTLPAFPILRVILSVSDAFDRHFCSRHYVFLQLQIIQHEHTQVCDAPQPRVIAQKRFAPDL